MFHPKTLFGKTGLTLTISLTTFLLFSILTITLLVLVPVSRQAADDLAALMVLTAKTWGELPPYTRQDFEQELRVQHNIRLQLQESETPQIPSSNPALYLLFLEDALARRTGRNIPVMAGTDEDGWLRVNIPIAERTLTLAFDSERLGTHFSIAAVLIVTSGTIIILLTSLLLVKRITRPLSRLSEAIRYIGSTNPIPELPETGPEEMVVLARRFKLMDQKVRELLENRTTLLAGISHDLRTPISRMGLALEMIADNPDPDLIDWLRRDLEEMDQLIGQAMQFAKGVGDQAAESVDLRQLIDELVQNHQVGDNKLCWTPGEPCRVRVIPIALQRVINNLLDNAIRFSDGKPVEIRSTCRNNEVHIQVLDRGPGIPPDQLDAVFTPFYRIESSRNRSTGGSGLGLAIVRQLCEANQWRITLLNRDEGGTEACVVIPSMSQGS